MKMTKEEIQAKADELKAKFGVPIHPLVFKENEDGTGEDIIGFMKEPARIVKLRVLDKSVMSAMTAASELLDMCLIKEESDPRMYSEAIENDKIYIGACMAASAIIRYSTNQFKKK